MPPPSNEALSRVRRQLIFDEVPGTPQRLRRRAHDAMQQQTIWSPAGQHLEEDTARDSLALTGNDFNTPERRVRAVKLYVLDETATGLPLDGLDGRAFKFAEDVLPVCIRQWTSDAKAVQTVTKDLFFRPTLAERHMPDGPVKNTAIHVRNRAEWCLDHFMDQPSLANPNRRNYEIFQDCFHLYKYVMDERLTEYLNDDGRLHGQNGLKLYEHFDKCYVGFAATIVAKMWFGKHQAMEAVRCLRQYSRTPANQETFWCGVVPTLYKMSQYMSTKLEPEFGINEILDFPIKAFNESLKQRFMNHGVWSTSEATRLLQEEGDNALIEGAARNVCRGVNITFLRVAYHVFKDFGIVHNTRKRRELPDKTHLTIAQRQSIRLNFHRSIPMFFELKPGCYLSR